jgi:hypothetical protein
MTVLEGKADLLVTRSAADTSYLFREIAPAINMPDIGREDRRMTRREFVSLAGGTAVAWPLMARAQQQTVPIIAYLGASSPAILDPRQIEQFKVGLRENGLLEGQNIKVDYLWGEGSPDRLRQHAADLAKRNLNVIVTAGPQPIRAMLEAKVNSPIVFAILSDPISDGFVQSLARPGGNLTGLSMVGTDLESKRLQILKDGVPAVTKVMLLMTRPWGRLSDWNKRNRARVDWGSKYWLVRLPTLTNLPMRASARFRT